MDKARRSNDMVKMGKNIQRKTGFRDNENFFRFPSTPKQGMRGAKEANA
jgi:hypothetical protein